MYREVAVGLREEDEIRASIDTGTNIVDDHNWNRLKVSFSEDWRYEQVARLRLVAIKDLSETLLGTLGRVEKCFFL